MSETAEVMPRRKVLKIGGVAAATTLLPAWIFRYNIADTAGKLADEVASPEKIMHGPIPVLVPRENDTPVVSPRPKTGEAKGFSHNYTRQGENVFLHLNDGSLQSEHTGTSLASGAFQEAGTGIITSAEGPLDGKQEYCRFFRGEKDNLIAAGVELLCWNLF